MSLPEAEIFIMMSDLDLQIFTREGATGRERETNQDWVELPKDNRGFYQRDIALWVPRLVEEFLKDPNDLYGPAHDEGVHFDFHTHTNGGIGLFSRGKAEVWVGNDRLLGRDEQIITSQGVRLASAQAVNPGGRAEIFFTQPGQSVELKIIVNEEVVQEVRIVSVAGE